MFFLNIKLQIGCLFIILLISMSNVGVKRLVTNSSEQFKRIFWVSIINLLLDIVTAYTVNHIEDTYPWANAIYHKMFYISICFFRSFCFDIFLPIYI